LRRSLRMSQEEAVAMEKLGRLAKAMTAWNLVAFCHLALGNMPQVQPALDRAFALYARATGPSFRIPSVNLNGMKYLMVTTTDEGWDSLARASESRSLLNEPAPKNKWSYALVQTVSAVVMAHLGRTDLALQRLASLPRALELASPSESNVGPMACDAAGALWLLNRSDHCSVIERALLEKVIAPDFRFAMRDARLALARLCALQQRYDEAEQWFEKARVVLDEQGALPLRAIADFDQGLMYTRRGDSRDTQRARPYFEDARRQFVSLGMNGWISRIQTTTALTSKRL